MLITQYISQSNTLPGTVNKFLYIYLYSPLGFLFHIGLTSANYRVSSLDSKDTDPSILLNGHFDSPPGSPGASDCGSCVGRLHLLNILFSYIN